jgi:uncharacterized membrane protein
MKMGLGGVIASLMLTMLGIGVLIWGIQYVTAIKTQGLGASLFGGIFTTISAVALKEEWIRR